MKNFFIGFWIYCRELFWCLIFTGLCIVGAIIVSIYSIIAAIFDVKASNHLLLNSNVIDAFRHFANILESIRQKAITEEGGNENAD